MRKARFHKGYSFGLNPNSRYFYVTDGWSVYPGFILDGDQIISKTANRAGGYLQLASGGFAYMTRVEGENTRLRHYLARLHRSFVVLFQVRRNVEILNSIATSLLKIPLDTQVSLIHT